MSTPITDWLSCQHTSTTDQWFTVPTTTGSTSNTVTFTNDTTGNWIYTGTPQIQWTQPTAPIRTRQYDEQVFNPYLVASDLVERFMQECRALGLSEGEFLNLPLQAFLRWLVIEAVREDGQDADDVEPPNLGKPRCLWCGRFLARRLTERGVRVCSGEHLDRYLLKEAA